VEAVVQVVSEVAELDTAEGNPAGRAGDGGQHVARGAGRPKS